MGHRVTKSVSYRCGAAPNALIPDGLPIRITGTAVSQEGHVFTINASGIANIVEDTTPQLGGDLDTNGFDIDVDAASAINIAEGAEIQVDGTNRLEFVAPMDNDRLQVAGSKIVAEGTDTNIDLELDGKGTGVVKALDNLEAVTNVTATGLIATGSVTAGSGEVGYSGNTEAPSVKLAVATLGRLSSQMSGYTHKVWVELDDAGTKTMVPGWQA